MNTASRRFIASLTLAALTVVVSPLSAITLNFSNLDTTVVESAGGGAFHFTANGSGQNLQITSTSLGSGSANGLFGSISGIYTIGAISSPVAGTETASVTGTGTFKISDGSFDLTGDLEWVSITQTSFFNGLNLLGSVNLTNLVYGGSNADLLTLAGYGSAVNAVTFQFVPAVTLTDFKAGGRGDYRTSFSGSVATPDGGATVMLLGAALGTLALMRRKVLA